jgi:hypothetical protein
MDLTTITNHILNGQTSEQFVALLFWGLMGFFCSILIELLRHTKKIKTKGGFDFVFWFKDNSIRFILSVLTIIIGVLFTNDLIGKDIGNFSALLSGLVTDKIIEALTKFKSIINVYGTKSDN